MDENVSLKDIIGDLSASAPSPSGSKRAPVTVWLSPADKSRYDRIQASSGRKFSKKLRELFLAALDVAEKRSA